MQMRQQSDDPSRPFYPPQYPFFYPPYPPFGLPPGPPADMFPAEGSSVKRDAVPPPYPMMYPPPAYWKDFARGRPPTWPYPGGMYEYPPAGEGQNPEGEEPKKDHERGHSHEHNHNHSRDQDHDRDHEHHHSHSRSKDNDRAKERSKEREKERRGSRKGSNTSGIGVGVTNDRRGTDQGLWKRPGTDIRPVLRLTAANITYSLFAGGSILSIIHRSISSSLFTNAIIVHYNQNQPPPGA